MSRPIASPATAPLEMLVESSHDFPLVDLTLAAHSGASNDRPGKEGALAIALRSLRRGAGARRGFAIDDEIDRLGADFGAAPDVATASIHATVVRRNLEPFLALLADLILRPTFDSDEVARVIREASADIIDARADDRTLAARAFTRRLFAGHPYGRPAGGLLSSLAALTRDDVAQAFASTFVRANVVVGACGDITAKEVSSFVSGPLALLPDRAPPPSALPPPAPRRGRRLVIVDKPERTQTQIYIGGLGTHARDRDHHALYVANTIFGGMFTARLMREIRSKRGWSYGASSSLGIDRERHSWYMHTYPSAQDTAACIELQLAMLSDLVERGVTERELQQAKSYLVRGNAFARETPAKRLAQRLDERLTPLPKGYYANYVERIRAVTREQANTALRNRLSSRDLVISVVATASELRGALESSVPDLVATSVVPFDEDSLPSA